MFHSQSILVNKPEKSVIPYSPPWSPENGFKKPHNYWKRHDLFAVNVFYEIVV